MASIMMQRKKESVKSNMHSRVAVRPSHARLRRKTAGAGIELATIKLHDKRLLCHEANTEAHTQDLRKCNTSDLPVCAWR